MQCFLSKIASLIDNGKDERYCLILQGLVFGEAFLQMRTYPNLFIRRKPRAKRRRCSIDSQSSVRQRRSIQHFSPKVREFLEQYQPSWPVLLDPHRQVKKAYQIERIPAFILIDKSGNWQYSFMSLDLIGGQPLISMIEALLSD